MAETDDDWRELFETYRIEVIRAGFGAWDEAAFANDDPDEEPAAWDDFRKPVFIDLGDDRPGHISERFERYAKRFVKMLSCLEAETVDRLIRDLGELIRTRNGEPVATVVIQNADGEAVTLGTRYQHEGLVAAFQALNETLFSPGDPAPLITPVPA